MVIDLPMPPPEGWTLDEAMRHMVGPRLVNDWMDSRFDLTELRKQLSVSEVLETRMDSNLRADPSNSRVEIQAVCEALHATYLRETRVPQAKDRHLMALRAVLLPFKKLMREGRLVARGWMEVTRGPREAIHPETWDAFRDFDIATSSVTDGTTTYREIRFFAPAETTRLARQVNGVPVETVSNEKPEKAKPHGRPKGRSEAEQYAGLILSWWPSGAIPEHVRSEDLRRRIQEAVQLPISGVRPSPRTISNAKAIVRKRIADAGGDGLTPASDDLPT